MARVAGYQLASLGQRRMRRTEVAAVGVHPSHACQRVSRSDGQGSAVLRLCLFGVQGQVQGLQRLRVAAHGRQRLAQRGVYLRQQARASLRLGDRLGFPR